MNFRLRDVRLKAWLRQGGWSPLVELVLVAALGITLAHWTWVALTPRAIAASAAAGGLETQRAAPMPKRNLFGVAQEGKAAAVVDASPTSRIRLLGIISRGAAAGGRAIFVLETGKPKTVEAGSQIVPGLVLKEVHADYVLVARSGSIERMRLDRRSTTRN